MNELTYGISIYVEDSGKTYHTLNDWGFALGNNNYIGDPEMETTYIQIPRRDGMLDASEVVSGRRIYKQRSLEFSLGGIRERRSWDGIISELRNEINGRVCKLTIDNDKGYYWRGRVYITEFDRFQKLGTFTLSVPMAEPYKYAAQSSGEPWLWDPFNFQTGIITYIGQITVSGSASITIPHGYMPATPEFIVSSKTGDLTVTVGSISYYLNVGTNKIPSIMVGGDTDVELVFAASAAKLEIFYRSGSL